MTRIGLMTSGGDAPGMNAAVRAVVRSGTALGWTMFGICRGYRGLIEADLVELDNRAVGGIIERGGTMLLTARSPEFMQPEGQQRALEVCREYALDGIVVIGGNGSLRGARWLSEHGVPTIGVPASIDNDIPRTRMAIGVDSALNTVVDCLNRLRDTAIAHERAFVVEVMGRHSGYIALMSGLAGGAEIILLPEHPVSLERVGEQVSKGIQMGKRHSILVVAEGFAPVGDAANGSPGQRIAEYLTTAQIAETRLTILGHLQRGGSPTALDRILACRFSDAAVQAFDDGFRAHMIAWTGSEMVPLPLDVLDDACENVEPALLELADTVAH